MAGNQTLGSGASGATRTGGAGLSARQVQMRSMIQAVGMLPVLIILCIAFHYMTGARFFTTAADPTATGFRTADSDLAELWAQTFGGAIAVDLPAPVRPRFLAGLQDLHLDAGFERYSRSNDLWVNITTCGFGFQF